MAYYRLYFMDGLGAHIRSFEQFEAASDAEALAAAAAQRSATAMELWCERRKVMRWEALWPQPPRQAPAAHVPLAPR